MNVLIYFVEPLLQLKEFSLVTALACYNKLLYNQFLLLFNLG